MKRISLAFTGFVQVILVAFNTYQISKGILLGSILVGVMISLVWTYNVKRVAFSDVRDRLVYAAGAGVGTFAGILLGKLLYT